MSVAKRGSNEIASCFLHFFNNVLPNEIETLFLYSDGCGGQNKTTLSLLSCSFKAFKKIHRIFPISDHSFLPCDRDFASVKLRKRKVETLYIPDQWISIIDEGSRVHNKFDIVKVTNKDILDFKSISSMFRKVPRCETSP